MSKLKLRIAAVALACVLTAGLSARAEDAPASQPAELLAPATQPGELVAPLDWPEPVDLQAIDRPNDNGKAIMLLWRKMDYEAADVFYEVLMSDDKDGPFYPQGRLSSVRVTSGPFVRTKSDHPESFGYKLDHKEHPEIRGCKCDNCQWHAVELAGFFGPKKGGKPGEMSTETLTRGKSYYCKLQVTKVPPAGSSEPVRQLTTAAVGGASQSNWFAFGKINVAVAMIVLGLIVLIVVQRVKRDPSKLFIRRIGGLEAVDDALGRAAEMGKPVFFCYGQGGLDSVVMISSMNMLAKIGEKVGEYGTEMKVTCMDYLVMQVSQEMVKESYIRAGRPDAYKDENIFFVTSDKFSYAAATGAMLIREKAGTVFFFGAFSAESLLLTETGAVTKAIQIGGTDSFSQIPFFITTCDYTLIGEEVYAASAYLSHQPKLVATVKGQDAAKAVIMLVVITSTALASLGLMWFSRMFWPM